MLFDFLQPSDLYRLVQIMSQYTSVALQQALFSIYSHFLTTRNSYLFLGAMLEIFSLSTLFAWCFLFVSPSWVIEKLLLHKLQWITWQLFLVIMQSRFSTASKSAKPHFSRLCSLIDWNTTVVVSITVPNHVRMKLDQLEIPKTHFVLGHCYSFSHVCSASEHRILHLCFFS